MIAGLVAGGCRGAKAAPSAPAVRAGEVQVCRGFTDRLLAGLTLDPSKGKADYLEIREEAASFMQPPCATASDHPTCEAALRRVRSNSGFASHSTGSGMAPTTVVTYLVATFGDRIETGSSEEELRLMLAPVDTTHDVELVAGCGRMLKTASGWEVTTLTPSTALRPASADAARTGSPKAHATTRRAASPPSSRSLPPRGRERRCLRASRRRACGPRRPHTPRRARGHASHRRPRDGACVALVGRGRLARCAA